ncbi:glycoside hydrolase family 172 protein [Cohnella sp. 56]|uniref:glycoside hydrolase family 172 protein n=1 Tax=Cohnella sp. 56 TaxID=3113722 RepID=UPI0030E82D89
MRCDPGGMELYAAPAAQTRWASAENPAGAKGAGGAANGGRKGAPSFKLAAGETRELAREREGSGIVRRIWLTISDFRPLALRGIRIDGYWDGETRPAVSAPLGDFFGTGLGRRVAFESVFFSNPEGRSYVCTLPMPFRNGMRLTLTNELDCDIERIFYDVSYTVGDDTREALYLHAHFRRENPTALQRDYEILPRIAGQGRYLGVNFGVNVNRREYLGAWWGEGELKIYLDGDRELPSLCGTGVEDYIGTAWGQGAFTHLHQGCQIADEESGSYCFYRYHVPDPVYFREDIRVTIQQIGYCGPDARDGFKEAGRTIFHASPGLTPIDLEAPHNFVDASDPTFHALFERQDDWSSCAYFYLDAPSNDLPALASVEARTAGLEAIEAYVERKDL